MRNGRGIWKVRATPARQTWLGMAPPISLPCSRIEPSLGASAPAIRLNVVLLPEPLGPISPRISPCASANDTFCTAVNPPNRLVSSRTDSSSVSLGSQGA